MKKQALMLQLWGIGDVIFTQSLAHDFINDGYEIIWPVKDHFVNWLNNAYPSIKFIPQSIVKPELLDIRKDIEVGGLRIIPIRFAEHIMGRPYKLHMVSKYDLYNKDWRMWKRDAMPQRNITREKHLREELGIKKGMKYNFVHTKFGGEGQHQISINPSNDYPNIEMRMNDGYSPFDYAGIIENAEQIWAVSSATLYLFAILDLKATEVHIFNRTPIERNLDYVRFLIPENYILHE